MQFKLKVQGILDLPVPTPTNDAHAFVGIVIYYHTFILDCAIIAFPIFSLFRKGKRFIWTNECQSAMDILKTEITGAPVPYHSRFLRVSTSDCTSRRCLYYDWVGCRTLTRTT